jgi:apolipoprotein N-acyltransferase
MNVIAHRPKAVELALVQAGYTLADIRGEREVHTYEEPPSGLAALVGDLPARVAHLAGAAALALGVLAAAETGLSSALVASVVLAYGLHVLGEMDPEATEVAHEVQRPGMSHHEVQQRMVQWDEWKRQEKQQAEKQQRQAQAQASTQTPGRRG